MVCTQMSTVCYEILNVLSSNEHVAARMAKDPSLRAALVGEVRRQIVSWKSSDSGDEQYAPEQIHDGAPGEGDFQGSTPPARQVRQIRRLTGGMGVEGRNRLDTETDPVGSAAEGSDGNGNPKHNVAGASSELVAGDIDVTEANAAAGTIILDPFYAALTLRTLSNVMRASRIGAGQPSAAASQSGSSVSLKLPWPARVLYGGNDYDKVQSDGAAEEAAEWPVERKLVEDLAELMLSVSARGPEGVSIPWLCISQWLLVPLRLRYVCATYRTRAIIDSCRHNRCAVTVKRCLSVAIGTVHVVPSLA